MNKTEIDKKDNNLVFPIYAALISGLMHYLYYFITSFIDGSSFQQILSTLIKVGFFMIAVATSTWLILSTILTPLIYFSVKIWKKEPISKKVLSTITLLTPPITFLIIIVFLFFHLAIGMKMSI